jgi:hypothetical protein
MPGRRCQTSTKRARGPHDRRRTPPAVRRRARFHRQRHRSPPVEPLLADLGACTSMAVRRYAEHKEWRPAEVGISARMDARGSRVERLGARADPHHRTSGPHLCRLRLEPRG